MVSKIQPTKPCAWCGKIITKTPKHSAKLWAIVKACSIACKNRVQARPMEDRFWDKVPVERNENDCWVWQGNLDTAGYGILNKTNSQSKIKAHRLSVEIFTGKPIPNGKVIMHKCDNPPCVNPHHLEIGTQRENIQDAGRKGRMSVKGTIGEKNGQAKLKEADVREIRYLASIGQTYKQIACKYFVSDSAVGLIVRRKKWKHIGE